MKIQDGCNGFCSYCLIPYARGASRSVPAEAVLAEFDRQIHRGVKEIVFTGIHIGDFGRDNDKHASDHPIVDLMQAIFERKGDWRLRISSLEPSELTRPLIEVLHANRERFSPHFHLPLQSGCDRILKLMRRSYDTQTYREAAVMTRAYFPEANIGADVIPGFPGESAADFDETCEFVTSLDLSYLHVFPYSKRPNTAAERMPHHIDPQTIKARAKILRDLSLKLSQQYARKFIGHSAHVVWEDEFDQQQRRRGYTENYLSVAASKQLIVDTSIIQKVRIAGYSDHQNLLALDAH
jgi:threonylcarbamoyladenosine tRNA methylthiotransferase MtaB